MIAQAALARTPSGTTALAASMMTSGQQVHTVIAHEPPLIELLPDRAERHAGNEDVIAKWLAGDHAGSWLSELAHAATGHPLAARDHRTSRALATALGHGACDVPGHTGFAEDPEGFATRLRSVLSDA